MATWVQQKKVKPFKFFANFAKKSFSTLGFFVSFQVTRVIIEASTHRVHLRKSNTLTFDSTGSSKPLGAIASTIAQFMDVPYVRCDCSFLNPVQQV